MSHIATVSVEVRSLESLQAACRRLNLPQPTGGTHTLFGGQTASGYAVSLPAWRYPVVFDLTAGQARYDNYNGKWGDVKQLHSLTQAYAVCAAKKKALQQGFQVQERRAANGAIQLVCSK